MALIEWHDEYSVGVPEVDYEHRELIDLINTLHDNLGRKSSHDAIADFLGEIYAKISAHFALEEKFMRDIRYDQYEDHKADHERLLDEIRDIMDEQDRGAYVDYESVLSERLSAWFGEHFKTHDARLHRAVG